MPSYMVLRDTVFKSGMGLHSHRKDHVVDIPSESATRHYRPVRDTHESESDFEARVEIFEAQEASYKEKRRYADEMKRARKSQGNDMLALFVEQQRELKELKEQFLAKSESEPEAKTAPKKAASGKAGK